MVERSSFRAVYCALGVVGAAAQVARFESIFNAGWRDVLERGMMFSGFSRVQPAAPDCHLSDPERMDWGFSASGSCPEMYFLDLSRAAPDLNMAFVAVDAMLRGGRVLIAESIRGRFIMRERDIRPDEGAGAPGDLSQALLARYMAALSSP